MNDIMILFLLDESNFLLGRILSETETDVFDPVECNRDTYIDEMRKYMISRPPKKMRLIGEIALCEAIVNEISLIFNNLEIEIQAFLYAPNAVTEENLFNTVKDYLPEEFQNANMLSNIEKSIDNVNEKKTDGGLYFT